MNWGVVQGNAALAIGAVLVVWVFLLRTNIRRILRLPLALLAVGSCYVVFAINDKLSNPENAGALSRWGYENAGLVVVTLLVFVLPVVLYLQGKHERRCAPPLRRSHPQVRAHR